MEGKRRHKRLKIVLAIVGAVIAVIFAAVWLLDVVQTSSGGLVSFLHA